MDLLISMFLKNQEVNSLWFAGHWFLSEDNKISVCAFVPFEFLQDRVLLLKCGPGTCSIGIH